MKSKSLQKNISEIKGVGPKVKEELNKIGINYIQDALFLLPKKYENRTKLTSIKDLTPGEAFQFVCRRAVWRHISEAFPIRHRLCVQIV